MGNSEVGHLNIGAGRVVWQDVVRIDQTIKKGELNKNDVIMETFKPQGWYWPFALGRLDL